MGQSSQTFHRPPREWPEPAPSEEFRIHAPPTKPEPPTGGMVHAMFPAIGSFGLLAFALVYDNPLFMYIALGLVCLSILLAVLIRWSQVRSVKKRRNRNRRKYHMYLTRVERDLGRDAGAQLAAMDRLYPDHEKLWAAALARAGLWERRSSDRDFLELRVGRGRVPHSRPVRLDIGDDPLADRELDLEDEASTVKRRWERVNDVPVTVDLRDARVVTIVGAPEAARALSRSLVSQLAVFRAPDDLRVLASYEPAAAEEWEWVKWLPHGRAEVRARQDAPELLPPPILLASSGEALGRLLEGEVGPRLEQLARLDEESHGSSRPRLAGPHLVVFVDGWAPDSAVARMPLMREVLEQGDRLAVTAVLLAESSAAEASEADVRILLSPGAAATVEERRGEGGRAEGVWPDAADLGLCEAIARTLAPLRLEDRERGPATTEEVRALELLGLRSAAEVDPRESWRPRPRRDQLRVPIGVGGAGEPVTLDLKQAAEGGLGPHGLIVGATGSGKSELLRTMISGLALRHPPDTLSFVLIDYKGGAAFAELARLPHAAGLITNLQRDGSLVDRMRDALLGEQERRQAMLRDAGNLDDIRAYRQAREQEPSLAPMPYLLVVVDEFGELLSSRPEFIDLFLGIGRVGRSLGMHLLFSSQRLEEGKLRGLESHLRYRICLRTYSAVESKVVLGTPDAYLLPPFPGAAYLKVDTVIYERFKVALVSGSGREEPDEPRGPVTEVAPFAPGAGAVGAGSAGASADEEGDRGGSNDLDVLVESMVAAHGGGPVHQVWVPPLPRTLEAGDVERPAAWWERERSLRGEQPGHGGVMGAARTAPGVAATVGLVDLPAEQRTTPLSLDFAGAAGHLAIVGAPQSGKSTFLKGLVTALAREHTPEEVRLYCIDLGGGALAELEAAPHVGGVATKLDRERARQSVRHVQGLLEERELAFRRLGLASMADARARRARGELDEELPDVFLVVDNWAALRRDFEGLDQEVEQLANGGLNYGVHLLLSANRWAEIRPHLRDNVGSRLELRLNDPIDSEHGRRVAEALPGDVPGRGLAPEGLHFQAALPDVDAARQAAERWRGAPAPPVPMLPLRVEPSELPGPGEGSGVPIGVDELRLEPVYLDLAGGDPHFLVLGDAESGKSNFLRWFAGALAARQDPGRAQLLIVDYRRSLLDLADAPHVRAYAANAAMATALAAELRTELTGRMPGPDATREELMRGASWTGPRLYLLVDDYDLVPGAAENPLLSLVDLLAHGRDVGFHLVLARRVGGVSRSAFEAFYQRVTELRAPGLILSGDPDEGPLIGGRRAMPLPPGRGWLVRRDRRTSLIQTPLAAEGRSAPATPLAEAHTGGRP
ncbi:MAG TPA: type VII secretion protein EccCa [Thermoleophilaceae bacterium]|nr:type VII secretion protein EccCa [Thermoleophilaceae bacterium]